MVTIIFLLLTHHWNRFEMVKLCFWMWIFPSWFRARCRTPGSMVCTACKRTRFLWTDFSVCRLKIWKKMFNFLLSLGFLEIQLRIGYFFGVIQMSEYLVGMRTVVWVRSYSWALTLLQVSLIWSNTFECKALDRIC